MEQRLNRGLLDEKISPKSKTELRDEEKLLCAIFGEKIRKVRDI
jgi:DNA-directed RNA polymerase beta subunit